MLAMTLLTESANQGRRCRPGDGAAVDEISNEGIDVGLAEPLNRKLAMPFSC